MNSPAAGARQCCEMVGSNWPVLKFTSNIEAFYVLPNMAITSIHLTQSVFDGMGVGISELPLDPPIEMRNIGRTVVLAGPNGGGKSRLLRLLPKILNQRPGVTDIQVYEKDIQTRKAEIEDSIEKFAILERSAFVGNLATERQRARDFQFTHQMEIDKLHQLIKAHQSVEMVGVERPRFVSFVPTTPKLEDTVHLVTSAANTRADDLANLADGAHLNAVPYAERIVRKATNVGYARLTNGGGPLTPDEEVRDNLVSILQALLGPNNSIHIDNASLAINGETRFTERLSPGQQILFQFGCLLHANKANLSNCIVVMDEPENHLHPGVLAQIIEALQTFLSDGQLWIATHSIPLIAQLMAKDRDCLWFVSEGRVKKSGRSPERVLDSLMGGPLGATHLHDLTLLPAQYAALRFMTECLEPPGVVGADVTDPQTNQIADILEKLRFAKQQINRKVRVLDFGAGKARLLATLRDQDSELMQWLDYYAYDIGTQYQTECEGELALAYPGEQQKRWFSSLEELSVATQGGAFDVVVMCNVLHEIVPGKWIEDFSVHGALATLIADDGYLLLVEDYGIPVGERAHQYGFLLLHTPELERLFKVNQQDRDEQRFVVQASSDELYASRLIAHLISKDCLVRISDSTVFGAIESLHDRMRSLVKAALLNNFGQSKVDRSYALSAQLMANASVWLLDNSQIPE